jgi:hypothetical protein
MAGGARSLRKQSLSDAGHHARALRVLDTLDRTAGSLRTAARRVSLNRLISIEGGLFCRRPENVEMRALQSIGASQLCHGSREVQQDNLRRIGGNNGCDISGAFISRD